MRPGDLRSAPDLLNYDVQVGFADNDLDARNDVVAENDELTRLGADGTVLVRVDLDHRDAARVGALAGSVNVRVIEPNASFSASSRSLTDRKSDWVRAAVRGQVAAETSLRYPPKHPAGGSPRRRGSGSRGGDGFSGHRGAVVDRADALVPATVSPRMTKREQAERQEQQRQEQHVAAADDEDQQRDPQPDRERAEHLFRRPRRCKHLARRCARVYLTLTTSAAASLLLS